MLLLKTNILGMSFSVFCVWGFFSVSAENLKKSLNMIKGQILNVQCNMLSFPADTEKSDKSVEKNDNILLLLGRIRYQSGCELWQKGFTGLGKVWRKREEEVPSCGKRHFCRGVDHRVFLCSCGGILPRRRDAVCRQQGISVILSLLDSFGQRDCCSVHLLSVSYLAAFLD